MIILNKKCNWSGYYKYKVFGWDEDDNTILVELDNHVYRLNYDDSFLTESKYSEYVYFPLGSEKHLVKEDGTCDCFKENK